MAFLIIKNILIFCLLAFLSYQLYKGIKSHTEKLTFSKLIILSFAALFFLCLAINWVVYLKNEAPKEARITDDFKNFTRNELLNVVIQRNEIDLINNLVENDLLINEKSELDKVFNIIKSSKVIPLFTKSHSSVKWQAIFILNLSNSRKYEIQIDHLKDENTYLYIFREGFNLGEYKNDKLSGYLENKVNYWQANSRFEKFN